MSNIIYNPVFWIFISYAFGAISTDFLVKKREYTWFDNKNYLSDEVTKRIGVLAFGWLIKNTFMGWFNKNLRLKPSASIEELKSLSKEMDYAEAGHLIAFYFLIIVNVAFVFYGAELMYLIVFFILNVIFNLYLVFLQQHNKRRLNRIIRKIEP